MAMRSSKLVKGADRGANRPKASRVELHGLAESMGLVNSPEPAATGGAGGAVAALDATAFHIAPPRPECTCMRRALQGRAFIAVHCKMHSSRVKGYHPRPAGGPQRLAPARAPAAQAVARRFGEFEIAAVESPARVGSHAISRTLCDEMVEKYTLFLQHSEPWTPEMAEVFTRRSTLFALLRKWEYSRRDAAKAVALDETYVPGLYRLGVALYHLRRYDEAAAAFVRGRKFEPDNPDLKHAFEVAMSQARKRLHRRTLPPMPLPVTPGRPGRVDTAMAHAPSTI